MNREIKFRAWGAWHENMKPEMAYSDGRGSEYGITLDGQPVFLDWGGGVSELVGLTLMQYTGLKDKNGKEIYEDDIVREDDWVGNVYMFNGIYWSGNNGKVYELCKLPFCEVIGNIHENSELLSS